jgi:hypothetical protein
LFTANGTGLSAKPGSSVSVVSPPPRPILKVPPFFGSWAKALCSGAVQEAAAAKAHAFHMFDNQVEVVFHVSSPNRKKSLLRFY